MYQMMNRSENMNAAACSEAAFSCSANIALTMDAMIMASIIFSLRLRSLLGLLILGKKERLKDAVPVFA